MITLISSPKQHLPKDMQHSVSIFLNVHKWKTTINSLVHIPLHLYYCSGPNGKVLASAETVTIILLNRAWRLFNTHSTTSYRINDPVRLFFFYDFFPASISYFEVLFITRIPLDIYSFFGLFTRLCLFVYLELKSTHKSSIFLWSVWSTDVWVKYMFEKLLWF